MQYLRKYIMLCVTLLLCGMLYSYLQNLSPRFAQIEDDYLHGRAINLSELTSKDSLAMLLFNNGYVANMRDADFIADTLVKRLQRGIKYPNLYYLQKRYYGKVPALVLDSLSSLNNDSLHVLTNKLARSYELLGLCDTLPELTDDSTTFNLYDNNDTTKECDGKIVAKVYSKDSCDCGGVLVRLMEFYVDSVDNKRVEHADIVGYAKTDSTGMAVFTGLNRAYGYSVLPLKKGKEYGSSKGVMQGRFAKYKYLNRFKKIDYIFSFEQLEHRVQMIDNATLKLIKNDCSITVRTPHEYKLTVVLCFVLVLLAWWVLALLLRHRKRNFDPVFIASAMFITGMCVIVMFSIQNPLTEDMRGVEMTSGVLIGVLVVYLLNLVDFVKFYQNNYRFGFDLPVELVRWYFSPFEEQTKLSVTTIIGNAVWYKKLLAVLAVGVTFVVDIPLWLLLPYKRKVAWLVPYLKKDTDGSLGILVKLLCLVALAVLSPFLLLDLVYIVCRIVWRILCHINWFHRLTDYLGKQYNNIEKLYNNRPKGVGWLLLAIFITVLLWTPLGKEIGGMKVNLNILGLTFQPSEIVKYLILFFMAAFFTQNTDTIIAYSEPAKTNLRANVWAKVKTLGWVLGGLIVLMLIYACLGDMGPGVVIGITFVLLYSLIKSKVNLDNLSEDDKLKRIFTCDFALLIYGVWSFAAFLIIGYLLGITIVFALLWFLAWIAFGYLWHKRFFETAFVINLLVFMFIFGGDVAKQLPYIRDTDTAERFEQRTRMCVNTWGFLDEENNGDNAEAVSNTQVANGLWAIATGGMAGQGLGNGNPNLIPAFHTDMILSSIAEQFGWLGLVIVVLTMGLMLRRMVIIGYRSGHPFAFYFCVGVAIVTAVQFFIIALGSSGMIPLTGITVPFLSYGRVSMILNLIAFGVVLSLSKNTSDRELSATQENVRRRSVGDYNYPVSILTWTYIVLALFTLWVWQYYAVWRRGNTLVHPAFVYSREGVPVIEYNPRIALLTREMWAGNIYDRNGILLATSDKDKLVNDTVVRKQLIACGLNLDSLTNISKAHTKRYYPFCNQLFFMLGDINNGMYFTYDESNPLGYMAEAQHLSYLRGYDNVKRDKNGNIIKVKLKGSSHSNRFLGRSGKNNQDTVYEYVVRDNRELKKYLKDGIHGKKLRKHNDNVRKGNYDLKLTLDAKLQVDLQACINDYVKNNLNDNNLLRASVVVLDAKNGDLLTSANYPLPDFVRLRDEEKLAQEAGRKYAVYNDYRHDKDKQWMAYTDRDLGLTFRSMPGSTAKVMSAMAGLQKKMDKRADKRKYLITSGDIIESGNAEEPYKGKKYSRGDNKFTVDKVDMRLAIVESSNCYFVNLVNDCDLYQNLDSIYETVGVRIDSLDKKSKKSSEIAMYNLLYGVNKEKQKLFRGIIAQVKERALDKYDLYKDSAKHRKMNDAEWQWAWGQGTLTASPLNMARVVSAVVNNGVMPTTQYVISAGKQTNKLRKEQGVRLLSKESAGILQEYMHAESANQQYRQQNFKGLPNYIGGKTGTPERVYLDKSRERYSKKLKKNITEYYNFKSGNWQTSPPKKNDGWYMFFVDGNVCKDKHPLAVVVRLERGPGSGTAVRLSEKIIKELSKDEYIVNK